MITGKYLVQQAMDDSYYPELGLTVSADKMVWVLDDFLKGEDDHRKLNQNQHYTINFLTVEKEKLEAERDALKAQLAVARECLNNLAAYQGEQDWPTDDDLRNVRHAAREALRRMDESKGEK